MHHEVVPEGKVEGLTYDFDGSLLPGQIVLVPVGRRKVPGVVIKKVAQPEFKTKSILKVLYSKPLPNHLLAAVKFLHEYYLAASGQAVAVVLPRGVEKKRRKTEQMFGDREKTEQFPDFAEIPLNTAQKKAFQSLQKAGEGTKLLFGVTGSGKTNIYLKMALDAFKQQKSSIILVPEIALTGQLVRVFREVFGQNIVLIHSKQTEAERHLTFNSLLEADTPRIVIGPRSALFAPLNNLGLIVIDEEHENTYFQENSPKYSAIRVASFMAGELKIPLILGSATPTVEDYYLATKRGSLTELKTKARPAEKANIHLIDFKNRDNFSKNRYFANPLLERITENLKNHQQTLIFHNRRGSAPLTICEECGAEMVCPSCYLPLTLHADKYELVCHTCDHREKVPTNCPKCGHPGVIHKGFGTKLLENELKKLFPKAKIARFDADNKKDESLDAVYDAVKAGEIDILIGTQMLAKGLDLPKLATVGVVQADAGLSLPDSAAEERTFQLLTQVIGRVGRGHIAKTDVFIQTFCPEHEVLKYAMAEDYHGFYDYVVRRRSRAGFPPFRFVAKLEMTLKTEALVVRKVREAATKLSKIQGFTVSPPMPAFHERSGRGFTWQIIVRAKSRKALVDVVSGLDPNFKVTLDPPSLL